MKAAAWLLTVWAALRWAGLGVGVVRLRRLDGDARRQARRAAVGRTAWNVIVSVLCVYAWAFALRLQPVAPFVGFLAMLLMVSLVVAVATAFMQPPERAPESLDLFRLRPGPSRGS